MSVAAPHGRAPCGAMRTKGHVPGAKARCSTSLLLVETAEGTYALTHGWWLPDFAPTRVSGRTETKTYGSALYTLFQTLVDSLLTMNLDPTVGLDAMV